MTDVYYKSRHCNFFIDHSSKDDGSEKVNSGINELYNGFVGVISLCTFRSQPEDSVFLERCLDEFKAAAGIYRQKSGKILKKNINPCLNTRCGQKKQPANLHNFRKRGFFWVRDLSR